MIGIRRHRDRRGKAIPVRGRQRVPPMLIVRNLIMMTEMMLIVARFANWGLLATVTIEE